GEGRTRGDEERSQEAQRPRARHRGVARRVPLHHARGQVASMRQYDATRNGHPVKGARCVTRTRRVAAGRYAFNIRARNATGIHTCPVDSAIREEGRKMSGKNFDRYFISKRPDNAPRWMDNPRIFADWS